MSNPWKLILLMAGIFIAGTVTGTFVTMHFGNQWLAKRQGPDQWAPLHLKKLTEKLELNPEQSELIRPIIQRNMEELSRVRTDCQATTKTVFERMEREISEKLSPAQRLKYEKLIKEMRERVKRFMPDRKSRPFGPGNGPRPEREPPRSNSDTPDRGAPPAESSSGL